MKKLNMAETHDKSSEIWEDCGKALKPECECGFWMVATPKEKGYLWTCGRIECKKTRFEEVKR
jgi:hypothetical protein